MPSTKRLLEAGDQSHDGAPPNKQQRTDDVDFSGAVKKKLTGAARTGQACDRCKVRKIRCDARPGGCSPCAQNNTECRTTDRITGRATSRGHTETIEAENNALKQHIEDLHQQLKEQGVEPRPRPVFQNAATSANPSPPSFASPNEPHNLARILNPEPPKLKGRSKSAVLPEYQADNAGDNYLGISSTNEWPCPVGGTHHALFGMHLDFKDYVGSVDDELSRATTYQAFFEWAFRAPDDTPPPMPPYDQTRTMCLWYFKMMGAWLPVLHKPHVLNMVDRLYNEPGFKMTGPETMQLHLVLACILYQYTMRNPTAPQHKWVDHYRYALSFFIEVWSSTTLAAVQAIAMSVVTLRAFPKPGAVWMVSVHALAKAVEMGLHRSVHAWQAPETELDQHELEMRKRTFWTCLSCHVTVGSRLGRPFIVRLDDFDIELPKAVHDHLSDEDPSCSFTPAITAFESHVVQMQLYASLYTIRPVHEPYEQLQKRISKQIDTWVNSNRQYLMDWKTTTGEERQVRLYIDFGHQNLRLLLHHPSLAMNTDAKLVNRNLDVCLDASSKLLEIADEMRSLSVLDTTWFNNTYLLAAIFTTLFAFSQRKDTITSADLKQLKSDMARWVEIMGEVGRLLGSGARLQNALRQITTTIINQLDKHVAAKTASAAFASASSNDASPLPSNAAARPNTEQNRQQALPTFNVPPYSRSPANPVQQSGTTPYMPSAPSMSSQQSYATSQPYTYPDPAASAPSYSENMYAEHYGDDSKPDISRLAHSAAMASAAVTDHAPQQQNNFYYNDTNAFAGNVAWRHFADTMANSIPPPSQHWHANALMSLHQSPGVANAPLRQSQSPGVQSGQHQPNMTSATSGNVGTTAGADMNGNDNGQEMNHGVGHVGFDVNGMSGGVMNSTAMSWPIMGLYPANGDH